jgi:hypothetical protein
MMHDAIQTCQALARAKIWLELDPQTQTLIIGPTDRVQAHPELLQQVREQKPHILKALQETLAAEVLGTPDSGRFEAETCPECHHAVFVVLAPRRLAVHRTPNGQAVCPGAIQAHEAVAQTLLTRYIAQRCVQRPGSVLSWMALCGGLEGWAREQGWLLPPRPYLIAWMDAHYKRVSKDEAYPNWAGLTFTVEEWLGDDADPTPAPSDQPRRTVLKAS